MTIHFTEEQAYLLVGVLETATYNDTNDQTRAFKKRVLTKLAQAIISNQAKIS